MGKFLSEELHDISNLFSNVKSESSKTELWKLIEAFKSLLGYSLLWSKLGVLSCLVVFSMVGLVLLLPGYLLLGPLVNFLEEYGCERLYLERLAELPRLSLGAFEKFDVCGKFQYFVVKWFFPKVWLETLLRLLRLSEILAKFCSILSSLCRMSEDLCLHCLQYEIDHSELILCFWFYWPHLKNYPARTLRVLL